MRIRFSFYTETDTLLNIVINVLLEHSPSGAALQLAAIA